MSAVDVAETTTFNTVPSAPFRPYVFLLRDGHVRWKVLAHGAARKVTRPKNHKPTVLESPQQVNCPAARAPHRFRYNELTGLSETSVRASVRARNECAVRVQPERDLARGGAVGWLLRPVAMNLMGVAAPLRDPARRVPNRNRLWADIWQLPSHRYRCPSPACRSNSECRCGFRDSREKAPAIVR